MSYILGLGDPILGLRGNSSTVKVMWYEFHPLKRSFKRTNSWTIYIPITAFKLPPLLLCFSLTIWEHYHCKEGSTLNILETKRPLHRPLDINKLPLNKRFVPSSRWLTMLCTNETSSTDQKEEWSMKNVVNFVLGSLHRGAKNSRQDKSNRH